MVTSGTLTGENLEPLSGCTWAGVSVDADAEDGFTLGMCCDRRGDPRLEVLPSFQSFGEVERFWGSGRHWEMFDSIDVGSQCPRCTYQSRNMIYEQVIERDNMTFRFI